DRGARRPAGRLWWPSFLGDKNNDRPNGSGWHHHPGHPTEHPATSMRAYLHGPVGTLISLSAQGRLNHFVTSATRSRDMDDASPSTAKAAVEAAARGQDDGVLPDQSRSRGRRSDLAGAAGESAADRVGGRADGPGRRDAAEREPARA